MKARFDSAHCLSGTTVFKFGCNPGKSYALQQPTIHFSFDLEPLGTGSNDLDFAWSRMVGTFHTEVEQPNAKLDPKCTYVKWYYSCTYCLCPTILTDNRQAAILSNGVSQMANIRPHII